MTESFWVMFRLETLVGAVEGMGEGVLGGRDEGQSWSSSRSLLSDATKLLGKRQR